MIVDVAVVGAGLSGLATANFLHQQGLKVVVLEKSRGVGGRAATRRIPAAQGLDLRVDHGAQFFTARDPLFKKQVSQWLEDGICFPWTNGFHSWDGISLLPPDRGQQETSYACEEGMSQLGKSLAEGLDIRTDFQVSCVGKSNGNWELSPASSSVLEPVHAKALFLSAPIPQSLDLIKSYLPPDQLSIVKQIAFKPCLAVIVNFLQEQPFFSWNGIRVIDRSSKLSWIAWDSSRRGTRCSSAVAVLHAAPDYSLQHMNDTSEELRMASQGLVDEAARIAGSWFLNESEKTAHRWRYALPEGPLIEGGFIRSLSTPSLYLIGDGFTGGRVEGAWLSGHFAAKNFLSAQ